MDKQNLNSQTIEHFVWSVKNFFKKTTKIEAEIGAPYLFDSMNYAHYTGVIGISGSQKGAVYFNIEKKLLDEILTIAHPSVKDCDEDEKEQLRLDYSGEITNIISGNVRNYLGENFLISVPIVISSPNTKMHISKASKAIIFPITWKNKACHLILNLENNPIINNHTQELTEELV